MKTTEIIENYEVSFNKAENQILLTFAVEDVLESIPTKNLTAKYDSKSKTLHSSFYDSNSQIDITFPDFPKELESQLIKNNELWFVGLTEKVEGNIVFAKNAVLGSPIVNKSYKM